MPTAATIWQVRRRWRGASVKLPQALTTTVEVAGRCHVSLDFSQQRLPRHPHPEDRTEFEHLYQLCHQNLHDRYKVLSGRLLKQLGHELNTIETTGLAGFFLLVWDVVRFAKEHRIRWQGRGSAANSVVAYLLGITNVDPLSNNLLFERFLSENRATMPDIDIDFAASRREEVIQYVYTTYGLEHTAMVSTIITFQARSAVRDIGKALDLPAQEIDRLAKALDTHSATHAAQLLREKLTPDTPATPPAGAACQPTGADRRLPPPSLRPCGWDDHHRPAPATSGPAGTGHDAQPRRGAVGQGLGGG